MEEVCAKDGVGLKVQTLVDHKVYAAETASLHSLVQYCVVEVGESAFDEVSGLLSQVN